ncbi:MAG: hypothetical protein Q8R49_04335 [Rhodoferax sp.]|nr:hypothetical protein [Rhodoferax sp.]
MLFSNLAAAGIVGFGAVRFRYGAIVAQFIELRHQNFNDRTTPTLDHYGVLALGDDSVVADGFQGVDVSGRWISCAMLQPRKWWRLNQFLLS